jgi:hypothetical protein
MSWPIEAVVGRLVDGKVRAIPSKCKVGLIDGNWWMITTFDKDVTFKSGEELQISYKLDKPCKDSS